MNRKSKWSKAKQGSHIIAFRPSLAETIQRNAVLLKLSENWTASFTLMRFAIRTSYWSQTIFKFKLWTHRKTTIRKFNDWVVPSSHRPWNLPYYRIIKVMEPMLLLFGAGLGSMAGALLWTQIHLLLFCVQLAHLVSNLLEVLCVEGEAGFRCWNCTSAPRAELPLVPAQLGVQYIRHCVVQVVVPVHDGGVSPVLRLTYHFGDL